MTEVGGGGKRAAWRVGYAATAAFSTEGSTYHGWSELDKLRACGTLERRNQLQVLASGLCPLATCICEQ